MATGFKSGGRKPGTRNRRTVENIETAKSGGEMPLEYMLRRMRDPETEDHIRDDMAKSAAPYLHARLTNDRGMNIDITGRYDNGPMLNAETHGILVRFVTPRKLIEHE